MGRVAIFYVLAILYAAVRYVLFMPTNLTNAPVFIVNKGLAMAAAFCFSLAFWQQWRRGRGVTRGTDPATWFRAGIVGVICHIPLSLAILRPGYFKEFFDAAPTADGRMSLIGEAVLLFGALTAGGVYLLARQQWTPVHRWWLSLVTTGGLIAHTLCMGIARGMNMNTSHAYLPPMWLLSLIGAVLGAAYVLMNRPSREAAPL